MPVKKLFDVSSIGGQFKSHLRWWSEVVELPACPWSEVTEVTIAH